MIFNILDQKNTYTNCKFSNGTGEDYKKLK